MAMFPGFCKIRLLAQILGYKGIEYSSPTLASALANLTPALTFILAVIFRMEKLDFRSSSTLTKIIGTMVSISGALVVVFYKGPAIVSPASHSSSSISFHQTMESSHSNWVIGGVLLAASFILWSIWYIIQVYSFKIWRMNLTDSNGKVAPLEMKAKSLDRERNLSANAFDEQYSTYPAKQGTLCTGNALFLFFQDISQNRTHCKIFICMNLTTVKELQETLMSDFYNLFQTQIMQICLSVLVVIFAYKLYSTIITAPVCFIAEPNSSAWRIRPDIALVTLAYSAFFGPAFSTIVQSWCLHLKGPVYVTTFRPFSVIIAAAMAFIFLGDALHLGSVIGTVMISIGLYTVLSGKAREEKTMEERGSGTNLEPSSVDRVPLLLSHNPEDTLNKDEC